MHQSASQKTTGAQRRRDARQRGHKHTGGKRHSRLRRHVDVCVQTHNKEPERAAAHMHARLLTLTVEGLEERCTRLIVCSRWLQKEELRSDSFSDQIIMRWILYFSSVAIQRDTHKLIHYICLTASLLRTGLSTHPLCCWKALNVRHLCRKCCSED